MSEQILAKILEKLENMDKRFDSMDKRLDSMDKRLDSMDKRLDAMDMRLDAMDKRLDAMDMRLDAMDMRLDSMDKRLDSVEGQLEENTVILRALEHASQVNAAEIEGLKLSTATKESIQLLDAKFDILNKRLFEQEAELRLIKKAQ